MLHADQGMWRRAIYATVYAYIPKPNDICENANVTCNDEFGASISRGVFSFAGGQCVSRLFVRVDIETDCTS